VGGDDRGDGSPLVGGDDRKCLATPDLAKRDHSRAFLVIPAKAGIQSPLPRKATTRKV